MNSVDNDFYSKVYKIVEQIPSGKVTTYGSIAEMLGLKSSARMVGWALNVAKFTITPAHRVVNRNGELTGRLAFPEPDTMYKLLISENITFNGNKVDLNKHFWDASQANI